ncbi:MAG: autotransporter domain-containing protein [Burkholderiales bacterium]
MKPVRRVLPALLLPLFAAAAPGANAVQFSNVVVFGDSLSDAGYYRPFLAGLGLPSATVAALGRFTTNPGPVWSELVSSYYGVTAAPSNANGSIFAQGGATVATNSPSTPPGFAQRPVSTQITEYLARSGGAADPDALHTVWAGGNDFLNNFTLLGAGTITQAQFQTNLLAAAAAEVQQVGRLYAAGARYVMVFALPNLGITPFAIATGPTNAASATAASAGYNTTLYTGLVSAGLRAIPVDVFTLLNEIKADPAAYGFTNTTGIACGPFPPITMSGSSQFCGPTNLVAANADQSYLFADSVHPTTGAHRIVADFATSLVEGPVAYSMLGEVALRTRAAHVQTLADGLAIGQASPGTFSAFASAGDGNFEVESRGNEPGFDSSNRAYAVGLTMKANESVTIGAALGRTTSTGNFGGDRGGFRSRENLASVFFGARSGGFHASGSASIANLDISDSRRNVRLGQVTRVAQSSPSGASSSATVNAGYDFQVGKLTVGPTLGWTSQDAEINAFEESGAGSANLRIGTQKRRSEVASLGLRASFDFGAFTPYAKFTADKERKDAERLVSASPLSLISGNTYELPAYQPADSSWATVTVGVRGTLNPSVAYGLNYSKITGRSGLSEDYFSGTLSVRF